MLVKTQLLLILGLAAMGSSFTLPDGLSNGLYKAYYNSAGEEIHELVTSDVFNTTSPLPALPKREDSQPGHELYARWNSQGTWCGCAFPMNAGDTNIANAVLGNWAASSPVLGGNAGQYVIQNTAVAFVLNFDGGSVTVPSNLVSDNDVDISAACGNFIAGTSKLDGFAHLDYGYMNYVAGNNLYDAAESSTQYYCFSYTPTCPDQDAVTACMCKCCTQYKTTSGNPQPGTCVTIDIPTCPGAGCLNPPENTWCANVDFGCFDGCCGK